MYVPSIANKIVISRREEEKKAKPKK